MTDKIRSCNSSIPESKYNQIFRKEKKIKKCWRCGIDEVYDIEDNNGMCYNCYVECVEAEERERNSTFENGEQK